MKSTTITDIQKQQNADLLTVNGIKIPRHFGAINQEVQAFYQNAALVDCSAHAKISLTGPERQQYLHGMVSNDVNNLPKGQLNHSLTLTPQGKVVAELWVLHRGEELLLLTDPEASETAKNHLDKYLIMEEAEIEDKTASWCLFALYGPKAENIINAVLDADSIPQEPFHFHESSYNNAHCLIAKIQQAGQTHFLILIEPEASDILWSEIIKASATPAGMEALEIYRIERGIPKIFHELDTTVIPQEAHLDDCIDFNKGCYIGQETVAMLHFRGRLNRELTAFEIQTDSPLEVPIEIEHEGKKVGKITSVALSPTYNKTIGLGFMRCKLRKPGQSFNVIHNEKAITATITEII